MKKSFVIMVILAVFFSIIGHPASGQVLTIDTSGLSPSIKNAIVEKMQQDAITQKIQTYGRWAGMGKEIGIAASEGLNAVKDFTVDVSKTNVGKTVLFLIVWKVAGIDFIRIILGTFLALISIWLISKSYFRLFATRRLIEKTGWWIFGTKKYEQVEIPKTVLIGCENSWIAGLHWLFLIISFIAAGIIAFA